MSDNQLPVEVELAYEVMPCNALRSAQEPGNAPHPCSYFRRWGRYHSYDYEKEGPPEGRGIIPGEIQYVGRGPLVPELLSGCRKCPIMAVGINPNLPGWWPASRNAVNPLFDDYKQYAHYFRYRSTAKLQIPKAEYQALKGGAVDQPLDPADPSHASTFELPVPPDADGMRTIPVELAALKMYENYESLLKDLAAAMGWDPTHLTIGEDISYGNMVACPSAKWITRPDAKDPTMPPMTPAEQKGIVGECFHTRKYFLRQLFQSLPTVLMVFSQSTTDAFLGEMKGRFVAGDPKPGDQIKDLLEREVRLQYGSSGGEPLVARVIFSPHITGNPADFAPARARVLEQLVEEAKLGNLRFNAATGHLVRPVGSCVFCTSLAIGPCDYVDELVPLSTGAALLGAAPVDGAAAEKREQARLLSDFLAPEPAPVLLGAPRATVAEVAPAAPEALAGWELSGDPERQAEGLALDPTAPVAVTADKGV
jgi:hypothetical protein